MYKSQCIQRKNIIANKLEVHLRNKNPNSGIVEERNSEGMQCFSFQNNQN